MNTRNSVDQTTYSKIHVARFEPLPNPNSRDAPSSASQVRRSNSMPKLATNIFNRVATSNDSDFMPSPHNHNSKNFSHIERKKPNEVVDTPNNDILPYSFPTSFKPEVIRRRREDSGIEFLRSTANDENLYLNSTRARANGKPIRLISNNGTSSFMSTLNQGETIEDASLESFQNSLFNTEYINQEMALRRMHLMELENSRAKQRNASLMHGLPDMDDFEKPRVRGNDYGMSLYDMNNQTRIGKMNLSICDHETF
jgi:hypothetical protein